MQKRRGGPFFKFCGSEAGLTSFILAEKQVLEPLLGSHLIICSLHDSSSWSSPKDLLCSVKSFYLSSVIKTCVARCLDRYKATLFQIEEQILDDSVLLSLTSIHIWLFSHLLKYLKQFVQVFKLQPPLNCCSAGAPQGPLQFLQQLPHSPTQAACLLAPLC